MTTTSRRVVIDLPIPPSSLGPNGRAHWAERARLTREHREWAMLETLRSVGDVIAHDGVSRQVILGVVSWPCAVMHIHWKAAGVLPDSDSIVARCKAYRDGVQDAGLVVNDATIQIGNVTTERVPRADQCVVLTFEEDTCDHDWQWAGAVTKRCTRCGEEMTDVSDV